MDLSIIIVNYNVKEFLLNLLNSVERASKRLHIEIIVVDNASDDGSVEMIKQFFPNVILIENAKNLGFSKANNIGLNIAKGKFLLLLNPDTLVSEDTFETTISFLKHNASVGMVGCKILNPDGTLQLACRRSFPGPWNSFCKVTGLSSFFPKSQIFARYNLTYRDENKSYEVDAISGSFMMIRRELYEKIGGLDEEFFMYGEDLDWCYRTQKSGYKVYYVHATQIIHYKGESTKRSSIDETRIFYSAMRLFVKKHLSVSFFVESILSFAITAREIIAFIGRWRLLIMSVIIDILVFDSSLYLSERSYEIMMKWRGFPDSAIYVVYTYPVFLHIITAFLVGCYLRERITVVRTAIATVLSFFVVSTTTYFVKDFAYSRAVLLMTYNGAFILFILWRLFAKVGLKIGTLNIALSRKKTIIIGTTTSARNIASKLNALQTQTNTFVGFIGKTRKEIGQKLDNYEVIGTIETIKKLVEEKNIGEIIFSVDDFSYSKMMKLVVSMQNKGIDFKVAGSNMQFLVGKTEVSLLDDIPLVELSYNLFKPIHSFTKRLFDLFVSSFVIIIIKPVVALFQRHMHSDVMYQRIAKNVGKVFLGSWSLVGPKTRSEKDSLFLGKQGLTGYWFTDWEGDQNQEKLNIFYAKNHSIWLDVEILSKTFSKLFIRR